MGLRTSHLVSSESSSSRKLGFVGSTLNRTKRSLSCLKLQDNTEVSSVFCIKDLSPVGGSNSSIESSSEFTSEVGDTRSMEENRGSSGRNFSAVVEDVESFPHQRAQVSNSGNARDCTATVVDTNDAVIKGTSSACSGHDQATNPAQGVNLSLSHLDDLENNQGVDLEYSNSDLRSLSIVSDSLPQFPLTGDGLAHVTTNSSPGLVSDSDEDLRSGETLFHLDLVSISSNFLSNSIAEINSGETRRNSSRRQFWDALSRHSFRRHTDSPSIILAAGLPDNPGSREGWLLDFSDDHRPSGTDRSLDFFSARLRRRRNETRLLLRSEAPEGIIDGPNEGGRQTAICASGLHQNGECSCDSFFTAEESTSLASISRIIMLADALFEVLDEIHNQSLSLSLSTLSLPAPESTVDSFPVKHYKTLESAENGSSDAQPCYICLADYEEGEKLRVLPCNHEYHVVCIDKWLKEINRICPLCRHNVCEVSGECSRSDT